MFENCLETGWEGSAGRVSGAGPPLPVVDSLAVSPAFHQVFDTALPILRLESHQPHRAT